MLKIGKHAWKSQSWWTVGPAAGWQMNVEFGCRHVPWFGGSGKSEWTCSGLCTSDCGLVCDLLLDWQPMEINRHYLTYSSVCLRCLDFDTLYVCACVYMALCIAVVSWSSTSAQVWNCCLMSWNCGSVANDLLLLVCGLLSSFQGETSSTVSDASAKQYVIELVCQYVSMVWYSRV